MRRDPSRVAARVTALVAAVLLATLGSEALATDGCPATGLVGYWPAEGNANDVQGGNNGQAYGTATYATGKVGQAFAFDGSGGYVWLPAVDSSWPEGSIEMWVKYNSIGFYQFLGSGTAAGGIDPFFLVSLGWPGFSFGFCFGDASGCTYQRADSQVTPVAGQWYHVVGTWGPAGMKLYIDGQEQGASTYSGSAPTTSYHVLGTSFWAKGQTSINGLIDETKFYNCAMTADEVLANCLKGGGPCGSIVHSAKIAPAGTSCAQFSGGTAADLATVQYTVNTRGRISGVSPTAFVHYAAALAPASSFQLGVRQSNTAGWSPMGNYWSWFNPQVSVFDASCTRLNATGAFMPTSMIFNVTGATPGATYYVGIRYQADSVIGRALLAPYPTVTYSFITSVNGVDVPFGADSVTFGPK